MKKRLFKWLLLIILLGVYSLQAGCKANAPAPPAEVPPLLVFASYKGLYIDNSNVSTPPQPTGQVIKLVRPPLVVGEGATEDITSGYDIFNLFDENFLAPGIANIQEFGIPTDRNRTCFHDDTIIFSPSAGPLSNGPHDIKMSFANFDLNGDGSLDGFSGNTYELPIGVRFWLDDVPFLVGVFYAFPRYSADPNIPDDLGAGSFRFSAELASFTGLARYDYVQTGNDKTVTYYYKIEDPEGPIVDPAGSQSVYEILGHVKVSQTGASDAILKHLNLKSELKGDFRSFERDADYSFIGQYFENGSNWGGAIFANYLTEDYMCDPSTFTGEIVTCTIDEPSLCSSLNLNWNPLTEQIGYIVDASACLIDGFNLIPTGIPFLEPVNATDVAFPSGFSGPPPAELSDPQCSR